MTKAQPLEAKEVLMKAFTQLGGLPALVRWGRSHRAQFYTTLFAKLLPLQVNEKHDHNVNVKLDDEATTQKLLNEFDRVFAARESNAAMGLFYDADGSVIRDPERLQLEQQIHDLKKKRAAISSGQLVDVTPTPAIAAAREPTGGNPPVEKPDAANRASTHDLNAPAVDGNVIAPKQFQRSPEPLTPAQARENAYKPMIPRPPPDPNRPPTASELYERSGYASGHHWGIDWSGGHFSDKGPP